MSLGDLPTGRQAESSGEVLNKRGALTLLTLARLHDGLRDAPSDNFWRNIHLPRSCKIFAIPLYSER